jgi:hypothetical protein
MGVVSGEFGDGNTYDVYLKQHHGGRYDAPNQKV